MSVEVAIAGPVDAEALAELHFLSHTTSFAAFASAEWVQSRRLENYRKQWQEFLETAALEDSRARAWKVVDGGSVAGMVKVQPSTDTEAQLNSMHVHPGRHRQGIGTMLMDAAVAFMREMGYRTATLGVIQANTAARAMYERSGWQVAELRPTGVEGVPVAVYRIRL